MAKGAPKKVSGEDAPRATSRGPGAAPIVVITGDEEFAKYAALKAAIDRLLPASVDRGLALVEYDGGPVRPQRADDDAQAGGPDIAAVFDDLQTLPFLAERRVVVVREADRFVTVNRAKLEKYAERPAATGTLVLVCRSFPKTTRLYKAVVAMGGQISECKRLSGRALIEFVMERGRAAGKQLDYPVAARLVELIGAEQGTLANEVEKLALFALERTAITDEDVSELVGQSREERVFSAMDAAALGRLPEALGIWSQTLATDKAAAFKAVGGAAWVLRRWLTAHEMRAGGMPVGAIAPRVAMWGRERELETILRKLPQRRVKKLLAFLADLDAEAKVGARSIERGVEALLVELAA